MQPVRPLLFMLMLLLLSGCGALTAITGASAPMDSFTLSPVGTGTPAASGNRHLVVELPTSAGAVASDRIQIKPFPFQAQYLPDGNWSEPAPALLQTLLVASFQNMGGFGLVGRTSAGLMPDYTLMTELQEFHAEPVSASNTPLIIRISTMMTVIRESDRHIVSSRQFTATAVVASNDTTALITSFDSAMQALLLEVVLWTRAQTR